MGKKVLILGSNGRFGGHAARAFAASGWDVRKFDRNRGDLTSGVRDVDVVVNGWNPPDYSTWAQDLLAMHMRVIDAMKGSDATVVVPGNVYVFGARTGIPWGAASPHLATNPLGQLRIGMEATYRESGARTLILRGGDFLDTTASGNWFDKIMVAKLSRGRFTYPGNPDIPHAWAFLPDMARALVALCEQRNALPHFADIPFPGHTLSGHDMASALSELRGKDIALKRMSWWPLLALRPVWPLMRGLCEMRYLWDTPHHLDATPFDRHLPEFVPSSVGEVMRAATRHIASSSDAAACTAYLS